MRQGAEKDRPGSDQKAHFQQLAGGSLGCALLLLTPDGRVAAWTPEAHRLLGYREDDILGEPFRRLIFRPEEVERGELERELQMAERQGLAAGGRWYTRQDGTALWGEGVTVSLRDGPGALKGFAKLIRDRTPGGLGPFEETQPSGEEVSRLVAAVQACREILLDLLGSLQRPA